MFMKKHSFEARKLLSETELHELKGGENQRGTTIGGMTLCHQCVACSTCVACTTCKCCNSVMMDVIVL